MPLIKDPAMSVRGPYDPPPIVDGFTYSLSRVPSFSSYYQGCVAQLEVLRRANGYHMRVYTVPDDLGIPIPAYSQYEYQVRTQPGAYLYALMFAITDTANGATVRDLYLNMTDACTETRLFSDYPLGSAFAEDQSGIGATRPPCLMSQPYLMGPPALMNVEIYNKASTARYCQLCLIFAEPSLPFGQLSELLRAAGYDL